MKNDEVLARQQGLLLRSSELRRKLADQAQVFTGPLTLADRAQASLRCLYRNPQWPLGALLLLIALRPRRAVIWGGRLWWAWSTFKQARNLIARLPLPLRSP